MVALTKVQRLSVIIGLSFTFFLAEIGVGFYTHSLALVADAFHYLNDLVGFIVALVALKISERSSSPKELSFGWQRANLLGAFFNGVFLLALGVSILLQSIERFVSLQHVENPKLMLIVGCIGLALNLTSAAFLHEHEENVKHVVRDNGGISLNDLDTHEDHRHQIRPTNTKRKDHGHHDLGTFAILIHVLSDAANNVGVIIAAAVIWQTKYSARFYADPAVSTGIAVMIFLSSLPLVKKSGAILMESSPAGLDPSDVKHDLERIPGVIAVHELHIWRLDQRKALASAHVVVTPATTLTRFMQLANTITECLHAYGIHSATLQPEADLASSSGISITAQLPPSSSAPLELSHSVLRAKNLRPTERFSNAATAPIPVTDMGPIADEISNSRTPLRPLYVHSEDVDDISGTDADIGASLRRRAAPMAMIPPGCMIGCRTAVCEELMCCG